MIQHLFNLAPVGVRKKANEIEDVGLETGEAREMCKFRAVLGSDVCLLRLSERHLSQKPLM